MNTTCVHQHQHQQRDHGQRVGRGGRAGADRPQQKPPGARSPRDVSRISQEARHPSQPDRGFGSFLGQLTRLFSGHSGGQGQGSPASQSQASRPVSSPDASPPVSGGSANPSRQETGQLLDDAAQRYGIPPDVLKAMAYKESRWSNTAAGDGGQSHGIMQINSPAHPDYDVARGEQDAAYNIDYGAHMLSGLHQGSGDWTSAVRRYNGSGPMADAYAADVMQNIVPQRPWTEWGVN